MPKYTLVKTINADGKSPLFYFEGPSDATEPTDDWITDNSELLQKDTGVRKFKKGNTWEPIASSDGSGGSSGEGGSGGGQFVVTFSDVDFENMTIGLPDKSGEDIHAAVQANTPVVASLGGVVYLPLIQQNYESATAFSFTFAAAAGEGLLAVSYDYDSSEKTGINLMIPASYTELQALAPLIVNLTEDTSGENPAYVGDKTYLEIFDAYMAHKNVQIIIPTVGAFNVISCMKTEDAGNDLYLILYPDMGRQTIAMVSGGASDYFSIDS